MSQYNGSTLQLRSDEYSWVCDACGHTTSTNGGLPGYCRRCEDPNLPLRTDFSHCQLCQDCGEILPLDYVHWATHCPDCETEPASPANVEGGNNRRRRRRRRNRSNHAQNQDNQQPPQVIVHIHHHYHGRR